MRKWIGVLLMSLLYILPIEAHAANGSIEVELPKSYEGKLFYEKVGSMKYGQFELHTAYTESGIDLDELDTAAEFSSAAKQLLRYTHNPKEIEIDKTGKGTASNLEEGVYLLWGRTQAKQEMLPSLLFLPSWQDEVSKMQYEVIVVPKLADKESPFTGDAGVAVWGSAAGGGLFVALVIVLGKEFRKKKRFLP